MNAYELADELETRIATKGFEITKQSVNMLRQQADRIAELEEEQTDDLKKAGKAIVMLRNKIAELEKKLFAAHQLIIKYREASKGEE